jgi:putative acyl-CoA dehydrogenase
MAASTQQRIDPARTVLNQPPPLLPLNLFTTDPVLVEWLERAGLEEGARKRAEECGAYAGSVEAWEHCWRAEHNLPRLEAYDRYGHRVDRVVLDPSWHALFEGAVERGIHSLPWRGEEGGQLLRGILFMLYCNTNAGVMCPVSMTTAAVPALRAGAPHLAARYEPGLLDCDYERVTVAGMAMTERQGGSDVRANITEAVPEGDGTYRLYGHKWFCSYPPCDIFLVLAQAPSGLSCFLVERGPGMEFQRLKDKLGTRSLPSSEVEFHGIEAQLVGEEGKGVKAIITMVNQTRLDCALSSAAGMRRGLIEALHHARHRMAFGRLLADQPAMENVLCDLALEWEAAAHLALRVAASFDRPEEADFARLACAVAKYWICKRAPGQVGEALECLGGNGYVEDSGLPLLYRDSPLSSIWEGSGNVIALDVLRAVGRAPQTLAAFLAECRQAEGAHPLLDRHLSELEETFAGLADPDLAQRSARAIAERLALALQASLLWRYSPPEVAEAFTVSRLDHGAPGVYGTLPPQAVRREILERALPL